MFYNGCWSTPWGEVRILTDAGGVLWQLSFPAGKRRVDRRPAAGLDGEVVEDRSKTGHVVQQLEEYLAGSRVRFELDLRLVGSSFQRQVWRQLRQIPRGETRSYSQLATALGRPAAARAVGRANASNPIAIVVPCHRVIGVDGSLTGYAGGLRMKAALLELESPIL